MPVYRVTIVKQMETGPFALQKWSNVYHINRADMAAAALAAPEIADLEKTLYPDNVAIVRYSVDDPAAPGTGFSKTVFIGGTAGAGASATQLPLFNAVRVKLNVATGRASMKYLRLPLDESQVDSGSIVPALSTAISTNWGSPLVALGYVTDESGQPIQSHEVLLPVQMRQTGWHRRTRAGFHRGWVPN